MVAAVWAGLGGHPPPGAPRVQPRGGQGRRSRQARRRAAGPDRRPPAGIKTVPANASPPPTIGRYPAGNQDKGPSGRPLRPGASLESTSRFGEDRWDLRAAILQKQGKALALDFATVPPRYQATAKELFYLLLAGPHPHGVAELSISTVRQKFSALASFWHWLDARPRGAAHPAPVPAVSDLEDYHRHLLATIRTRGPRVTRKAAVRLLWFYRHQLSHGLPFDPCHLEDWAEPHPNRPGENRTDRIPESVMGPLLAWSLRFVSDFSGDILAAVSEATPLHAAEHRTAAKYLDTRALQDLLAWHEAGQRPLPGFRGKVNITFLARKLGCHRASLARLADHISATAAIVGIGDGTYLEARPSAQLGGVTWLDRIDYSGKGHDSVGTLARMLQTACYITISYLSGMRDTEIKHLRRGCLVTRRDPGGVPYRWKVTSLAFKGENDPAGVTAAWSVGRPVAEAITVLERLQPAGEDLLFARLAFREGVRPGSANAAISSAATSSALAAFTAWVNDYCGLQQRHDRFPVHGEAVVT